MSALGVVTVLPSLRRYSTSICTMVVSPKSKRLHHVTFTLRPGTMDSVREALDRAGPGRAEDAMLITPATDLADVTASQVIVVPLTASPPLPAGVPAEAWAHLALYRARPDAAAIARAQPVSGFAAAATTTALVPLHGQAAWLGESIPVARQRHPAPVTGTGRTSGPHAGCG